MGKERIYYLLQQYRDDRASADEVRELFRLMESAEGKAALKELMAEDWQKEADVLGDDAGRPANVARPNDVGRPANVARPNDAGRPDNVERPNDAGRPDWEKMWLVIRESAQEERRGQPFFSGWMRAAAVLIFCLVTGGAYWVWSIRSRQVRVQATVPRSLPIVPGGNRAVLTLDDGSTILLDSAKDGTLAQQGNAKVVKVDAGVLAYDPHKAYEAHNKQAAGVMYNMIATPYGGQYQVVLPDGSKVWLNAASTLRFPTVFAGKERRVELTGEGYFEIARDVSKPFVVHIGSGEDVQVLGTSFNIMAYGNEDNSRTTLVSGKVRVVTEGGSNAADIEPGRQAIVDHATHALSVADANVDQAIAWKNGLFRFRETGIRELMRQVERWYDVEVVYKTDGNEQDFTGIVSRSKNIDELLHTLELTKTVHFQIEGRKIIVLP